MRKKFKNIKFDKMKTFDIISLSLECDTKEEALEIIKQYEKYCDTPEIAHINLGYLFGYCNEDDRKKLYSLFPVSHPIFGSKFGRGYEPTPIEAVNEGFKIVKRMVKEG